MQNSSRSWLAALLEQRAGRGAALLLTCVVLCLGAAPLLAYRAVSAVAQGAAKDSSAAVEVPRVERFESPAAIGRAIFGFLEYQRGNNPAGLRRAAGIFDLGDVLAARRQAEGEALLQTRLVPILDRTQFVEPDGAPFADAAAVADVSSWVWTQSPPGKPAIEVRLGFARQADGGWLIDRETVGRMQSLYDQVIELPLLSGLQDKPVSAAELVRGWVPDRLERGGILLKTYQWIGLVVLVLLGVLIERVVNFALHPLLQRFLHRRGKLDADLLDRFERPIGAAVATLVFLLALPSLDIEPRYRDVIDMAASLVLAVAGVWAMYRLVDVFCWVLAQKAAQTDNRFDDMLVPLLRRTLKVLVVIVGVVFVASRITDDLWGVFAGLSIGSLALGFAAKDSVENLFGTFTVLLDNPFKLGDVVTVAGHTGTIEQVGIRSTRVRTFDGTLIAMPNSRFISTDIENLSARLRRRVSTTLSLTYDTPAESVEAFCEGVRELIRAHPWTWKESYHVWFTGYGASSLDVTLIYFIDTVEYATFVREQHRLNLDILRLGAQLGVDFAFPTQTLHLAKPEDLLHPDAPPDQASALKQGRERGRQLAGRTTEPFGGARPAPVRFDACDPDAIGPGPGPGPR